MSKQQNSKTVYLIKFVHDSLISSMRVKVLFLQTENCCVIKYSRFRNTRYNHHKRRGRATNKFSSILLQSSRDMLKH